MKRRGIKRREMKRKKIRRRKIKSVGGRQGLPAAYHPHHINALIDTNALSCVHQYKQESAEVAGKVGHHDMGRSGHSKCWISCDGLTRLDLCSMIWDAMRVLQTSLTDRPLSTKRRERMTAPVGQTMLPSHWWWLKRFSHHFDPQHAWIRGCFAWHTLRSIFW